MEKGYRILPVYDYSGLDQKKAPKLTAIVQSDSLVLPDLLSAKAGSSRWVEVKFKNSASFTRCTKRLETGISRKLWNHYQKVEIETGIPVYLVFAHKIENEVRCAPISALVGTERVYSGTIMGYHGMVFFDYSKLTILCKLSDVCPSLFPTVIRPMVVM